jgi:trans-aconitate methyltransferase
MARQDHWETVHSTKAVDDVSWWQQPDDLWLDLVVDLALPVDARLLDVGSGSSLWVDALSAAGYQDITALDVSQAALDRIRQRQPSVRAVAADVTEYVAPLPVALWHDRAVFHFLTEPADRQRYRENLHASLAADGHAIIATFAPDGPKTCSGLPVRRYTAAEIAVEVDLTLQRQDHRIHTTPWGSTQPFTVAVLSR